MDPCLVARPGPCKPVQHGRDPCCADPELEANKSLGTAGPLSKADKWLDFGNGNHIVNSKVR